MTPALRAAVGRPMTDLHPVYALRLLEEDRHEVATAAGSCATGDVVRLADAATWFEVEPYGGAGGPLWEVALTVEELDAVSVWFPETGGIDAGRISSAVLTAYLRGPVS